jgi:YHS domain-containing protein
MFKKQDPVCGLKINKNTEYFLKYEGRTYYFDCQACKTTFQKDPDRFLIKKSGRGFLNWLAKGSKHVPKSCHEMKK